MVPSDGPLSPIPNACFGKETLLLRGAVLSDATAFFSSSLFWPFSVSTIFTLEVSRDRLETLLDGSKTPTSFPLGDMAVSSSSSSSSNKVPPPFSPATDSIASHHSRTLRPLPPAGSSRSICDCARKVSVSYIAMYGQTVRAEVRRPFWYEYGQTGRRTFGKAQHVPCPWR